MSDAENGKGNGDNGDATARGALPEGVEVAFILGRTAGGGYFSAPIPPARTADGTPVRVPMGSPHDQIGICSAWVAELSGRIAAAATANLIGQKRVEVAPPFPRELLSLPRK